MNARTFDRGLGFDESLDWSDRHVNLHYPQNVTKERKPIQLSKNYEPQFVHIDDFCFRNIVSAKTPSPPKTIARL